jgi:hypothetical protein
LGLQVSVVVQNNQELKAPSLTCGAWTAAGCNAPWEDVILSAQLSCQTVKAKAMTNMEKDNNRPSNPLICIENFSLQWLFSVASDNKQP